MNATTYFLLGCMDEDVRGRALVRAAEEGHDDVVTLLLDHVHNGYWNQALVAACRQGRAVCVGTLLKAGASPESKTAEGFTALMIAARHGQAHCADILLKNGAAVDAIQKNGSTALMIAANYGRPLCVQRLLREGADVNKKGPLGFGCLMYACKRGYVGIARMVLKAGATVDRRGYAGFTPLMLAAEAGHEQCARVLLAAGADMDATKCDRATALLVAVCCGREKVARVLIEAGARVVDRDGGPLLPYKPSWRFLTPDGARALRTEYLLRRWREAYRVRAYAVHWMGDVAERLHAPGGRGRKRDRDAYQAEFF